MDGWMDGLMDGWMDGWLVGWVGQVDKVIKNVGNVRDRGKQEDTFEHMD